jgi:hypothetical protein
MLTKWTDHQGHEIRVRDAYERNRILIDLTAQPQDIKDKVDLAIIEQISHKELPQVGSHFLKFCGRFDLVKCSESAEQFGRWLTKNYRGVLVEHLQEGTK